MVLLSVIARLVDLVAVGKGCGRVVDQGDWRYHGIRASGGYSRIDRGGVDEWLEDGPGWAFCSGVVQLADAIVAASDQRQHLACMGIQNDQSYLRGWAWQDLVLHLALGALHASRPHLRHLGVYQFHARVHRLRSRFL